MPPESPGFALFQYCKWLSRGGIGSGTFFSKIRYLKESQEVWQKNAEMMHTVCSKMFLDVYLTLYITFLLWSLYVFILFLLYIFM